MQKVFNKVAEVQEEKQPNRETWRHAAGFRSALFNREKQAGETESRTHSLTNINKENFIQIDKKARSR